jgi:hypothetical protein
LTYGVEGASFTNDQPGPGERESIVDSPAPRIVGAIVTIVHNLVPGATGGVEMGLEVKTQTANQRSVR